MSALRDSEREEARRLLELVPDKDVPTVRRILSALAEEAPRVSLDEAPEDDEPVTQEDVEAQAEARADKAAGRVYSHEEAMRLILADSDD
jgi:hypothetical protein